MANLVSQVHPRPMTQLLWSPQRVGWGLEEAGVSGCHPHRLDTVVTVVAGGVQGSEFQPEPPSPSRTCPPEQGLHPSGPSPKVVLPDMALSFLLAQRTLCGRGEGMTAYCCCVSSLWGCGSM